jgi:hypothetical protein
VVGYPSETLLPQINIDARQYLDKIPRRPDRVNFAQYFHEIANPAGNYKK